MDTRSFTPGLLAVPALTLALTLAGCTGEPADGGGTSALSESPTPEAAPSSSELAVAQTGWLSIGADGAVQTTFFDADGRYRDLRNGEPFAQGGWEQRPDGSICFEPDEGAGACWMTGAPDAAGEIIVTSTDGKAIAIRRITYMAPTGDEAAGG